MADWQIVVANGGGSKYGDVYTSPRLKWHQCMETYVDTLFWNIWKTLISLRVLKGNGPQLAKLPQHQISIPRCHQPKKGSWFSKYYGWIWSSFSRFHQCRFPWKNRRISISQWQGTCVLGIKPYKEGFVSIHCHSFTTSYWPVNEEGLVTIVVYDYNSKPRLQTTSPKTPSIETHINTFGNKPLSKQIQEFNFEIVRWQFCMSPGQSTLTQICPHAFFVSYIFWISLKKSLT